MTILIDGSNFIFHKGKEKPNLDAFKSLLKFLIKENIPFEWFILCAPPLFPNKLQYKKPTEIQKRMQKIEKSYANWMQRVQFESNNKDDDSMLLLVQYNSGYHILSNDNFYKEREKINIPDLSTRLHKYSYSSTQILVPSLKWVIPVSNTIVNIVNPRYICNDCKKERGYGKFREDDGKPDLVWKCFNCGKFVCRGCIEKYQIVNVERKCTCGSLITGAQRIDINKTVQW